MLFIDIFQDGEAVVINSDDNETNDALTTEEGGATYVIDSD